MWFGFCCCINMSTTTLHLESSWEEVKEKLKETDHTLSDEDLEYTPGNEDELLKRLSVKMQRSEAHVKDWIESVSFNSGKAS